MFLHFLICEISVDVPSLTQKKHAKVERYTALGPSFSHQSNSHCREVSGPFPPFPYPK